MPPPNTPEERLPGDDIESEHALPSNELRLYPIDFAPHAPSDDDIPIPPRPVAADEHVRRSEEADDGSLEIRRGLEQIDCAGRPSAAETPKLDWRGLEYVGRYDEHLDCAICQSPLLEPRMTKCLHTFCRECFEQMVLEDDRCPLDRRPFEPFEDSPGTVFSCPAPPMVISLLDNLAVRCPNTRCDYVCARSLIEHHYTRDCPHTKVPCPDATCGKLVERQSARSGRCMHQLVACDYCNQPVELASLEDHYDANCEQNQITCQCCLAGIPKYRYGTHVANCPDRLVDCQYKTSGCTAVIKKKDAAEHERTCLHGMIVRLQRTHESDMDAMKAALRDSQAQVQQLELAMAARSTAGPSGQPPRTVPPPAVPLMAPLTAPLTIQPHLPITPPGMAPSEQPGTPPSDLNIRQAEGMPVDDTAHRLRADLDAFNARMEILERYVGAVDTRHALHMMSELAPVREQIVDLYNNLGIMHMHVRQMTESFRQTMNKSGGEVGEGPSATAGPTVTAINAMAAALAVKQDLARRSHLGGPMFPGRRLSDRENPPRL